MNPNKTPYFWEIQAVRLRYDEHLTRQEIAERLGLSFNQIRYIFSKPQVQKHIREVVMPDLWAREIAELEEKLKDRESMVAAYVDFIIAETKAKSCVWLGPGKRVFDHTSRSNRRRWQAVHKMGQDLGITDRKHRERNTRRNVLKYAAKLRKRLELVKAKLRDVPPPTIQETGAAK